MDAARRGDTQTVVWTTGWLLLLPLLLCEGKWCFQLPGGRSGGILSPRPQPFTESPLKKVDPSQRQGCELSYPGQRDCGGLSR